MKIRTTKKQFRRVELQQGFYGANHLAWSCDTHRKIRYAKPSLQIMRRRAKLGLDREN